MEEKKITVECSNKEQATEVIKYARKGTGLFPYEASSEMKYIVLFHTDKSYLGTHSSKNEWAKNHGHTIISYTDFERDYLKKPMKFEVGKWYKLHLSNTYWHYVKFSCYENDRKWIKYTESIDVTADKHNANTVGYSIDVERITTFIPLTDLTEIQKWLPNGHPDKKSTFIVRKWYKYNGWYIKYLRHDEDGVWIASEYIDTYKKYSKSEISCGMSTDKEKTLLTDLSEIQAYLPDGHPDKLAGKFIVGKWYKGWKDAECKFAKFHHISTVAGIEYFHWTEGIHKNWREVHVDKKAISNWYHEPANLVEASLEEVQIHLPEGHPDKIKSMTKNVKDLVYPDVVHIETLEQWNKIKEHHKIANHDPEYKYYLIGAGGGMAKERRDYEYSKTAAYNIIEFSDTKFPGLQYAEDYSPKEEKPMKFKVGELISFVNCKTTIPKWYCEPDIPRDKLKHGSVIFKKNVGKIEEIYKNFYIVSFIDESGATVQLGFKEDVLKKAEPMKSWDFEGRWVKCLKNGTNHCEVNGKPVEAGKYYQLTSKVIAAREGELGLKDGNYCGFASWGENQEMWKTIDFELMPEGFIPPKESLHDMLVSNKLVGRYIKALIDHPHGGAVRAGEVGKVIKSNIVDFPSQRGYLIGQFYTDKRYELMPEGWTPYIPTTPKETWKVGDWAFVTGEFEHRDSTGPEKFKKGEVFKVIQMEASVLVASKLWLHKSPSEFIGSGACRKATAGEIPSELVINVPKYVECINSVTNWLEIGEVYECKEEKGTFSWKYKNGEWDKYSGEDWKRVERRGIFVPCTSTNIKAGDWVKCIGESKHPGGKGFASCGWEKELIFKVTHTTGAGENMILWGGVSGNGVYNVVGHVRKAFIYEIPKADTPVQKVKVGDWIVPITPGKTGGCKLEAGKLYKVTDVRKNFVSTGLYGGDINHSDYRMAFPEEIPKENSGYNSIVSKAQWDKAIEWKGAVAKKEVKLYIPKKRRRIDPSVTRVNSLRGEVKQPKKVVLF